MDTIYYYKTFDGLWRFSTGVHREDDNRASQYLRMLQYSGREVQRLYPDNSEDKAKICEVFGYDRNLSWQDIYHDCIE